ncbi:hypothetical protein [Zunongwangia sp. H14]|uniref:hypothetical protein n=1 Tax=Zunongwangia sp. H14 TaxID=3240792 RepID=UPI0035685E70
MKVGDSIHFINTLNQLHEKYSLSQRDLKLIEKIKNLKITSIAFTTEGGFDPTDGKFHLNRNINYKIRIKYECPISKKKKIIVLMSSSD